MISVASERIPCRSERRIDTGWEVSVVEPDGHPAQWLPARVPGTAAGALRDAGQPIDERDLDAADCWFRTTFDADAAAVDEEVVLRLGGVATVAEVFLNGELLLESESMFLSHELDVSSRLRGRNELVIRCLALTPLLSQPRKPRARWRPQIAAGSLRWFRTTLLGRAPGFAPGPAAVGPWRPVVLERRRRFALRRLSLQPRLEGPDGVLTVRAELRSLDGAGLPEEVEVRAGDIAARLKVAAGTAAGRIVLPDVATWWPHTHGDPVLHDVSVLVEGETVAERQVGFRLLEPGPRYDVDSAPLGLRINGVDVFARGVVWTPVDPMSLAPGREALRTALVRVRDGGMNVVRVPGTAAYETEEFYDICDELGLLVWQDFMFANFDYPVADRGFRALVEDEARQQLTLLDGRPSLVVLCGNSEVEQQVAMLGLDPQLGRGELFGQLLPRLIEESGLDAVYVPSTPSGGDLPFRPDCGVANYYGVGGYRRGLDDARSARVGFAAECLALANVPDAASLEEWELARSPVHDPRWKAGVPRDVGTGWDFDDVRDWYLEQLYGVDPAELRRVDAERYLDLSRAVSGDVMTEVLGEWRRPGSPCAGALVLWLHDLVPGAGWGLVDAAGRPKVAYHQLRRALAPVAVWTTDEGLGGIDIHVANDRAVGLQGTLRVALYRDLEVKVDEAEVAIELAPHTGTTHGVEAVLGRFVDASWAYRFGPPGHDLVAVSLMSDGRLLSQTFRFPAGRPTRIESASQLGLEARAERLDARRVQVRVAARRLIHSTRIDAPGWTATDDAFSVEPGGERIVLLESNSGLPFAGTLTALNLDGRAAIGESQ